MFEIFLKMYLVSGFTVLGLILLLFIATGTPNKEQLEELEKAKFPKAGILFILAAVPLIWPAFVYLFVFKVKDEINKLK